MNYVTLDSLRASRSLTQRELAALINVTPSAVAMYETGDRTPSLEKAVEIAKLFQVPVESIIFGQNARQVRATFNDADSINMAG